MLSENGKQYGYCRICPFCCQISRKCPAISKTEYITSIRSLVLFMLNVLAIHSLVPARERCASTTPSCCCACAEPPCFPTSATPSRTCRLRACAARCASNSSAATRWLKLPVSQSKVLHCRTVTKYRLITKSLWLSHSVPQSH